MTNFPGPTNGSRRRVVSDGALPALVGAMSAAVLVPFYPSQAVAQMQASTGGDAQLQEIVVTGSLIKRTDIETPSPVQVLTAEDIQKQGYTNISQVLSNLSANGQGTLSQGFSGAFAAGGSGVALRGLSVGGTLTLIDGQRMVAYPISDDNERSFVDVSAIPINAVERVEVLKDGASAVYGADAIAGVVNIILKKSYTGTEFSAEAGTSQKHDGTTEHLSAISGMGDLMSDGYNAYLAVDYHHTDQVLATSRSGGFTNLDFSNVSGGLNSIPGAFGNPNVPYPGSTTGYLINPTTADPITGLYPNGLPAQAFLPGCSAAQQQLQQCTFRYKQLQLQPSTGQFNALAKLTKTLGNDFTTSVTASVFDSRAEQVGTYGNTQYAFGGVQTIAVGPGSLPTPISYPIYTLPAAYPGNPYGAAAPLIYNFPEVGGGKTLTNTNTYRLIWDVKGTAAGFDINGSLGVMYSRMELKEISFINASLVQPALNNGYVIGPSASYSAAHLIAPEVIAHPTSSLDTADIHASKTLFELPGGPFAVSLGAQFFHKVENDRAPDQAAQGLLINGNNAFALGSQNDTAAFAEFNAQVFKPLEVDGAVRFDHYNNGVGNSTTPKFSVKYKPFDMLVLRGTYGKGFRAPSIAESAQSGTFFTAGSAADPVLCPNPANINAKGNYPSQCTFQLVGGQLPGKNLKPVKSTNETLGFIIEPTKNFSVSADWYSIKLTDDIVSQLQVGGIGSYTELVRAAPATLPFCNDASGACAASQVTPVGLASYGVFPYLNASETKTEGLDVDLQSHFDIGDFGQIKAELNYTHVIEYKVTAGGTTYQLSGTHGPSSISGDTGNPKDRAVLTLSWLKGPVTVAATVNYTSHFAITDPSSGLNTCADGLLYDSRFVPGAGVPGYLCTIRTFVDTNLYASYSLTDNLVLHGAVTNVFNAQAPVDVQTYGGGGGYPYDPSLHQDGAIGRFFLVGAAYKFR